MAKVKEFKFKYSEGTYLHRENDFDVQVIRLHTVLNPDGICIDGWYVCKSLTPDDETEIIVGANEKVKKFTRKFVFKYEVGTLLHRQDATDVEIIDLYQKLDETGVCVDGWYVCRCLETGDEVFVSPFDKVKKFTIKLSADEKKRIADKERRESFVYVDDGVELLPWVEFPNAENLAELAKATEIGFDIETFGIEKQADAFEPHLGKIRLMQIYLPKIDKCIIWDLYQVENVVGMDLIKKKLASKKCKVYIHRAAFESKWVAEHLGIPIYNVVDSLILSQLYWAGLDRGFNKLGIRFPNSLEQVCLRLFQIQLDKSNQEYDYFLPLGNSQYNYSAIDAKMTYLAGTKLLEMCYAEGMHKTVEAELMAVPAFAQMNYKGVPVNVDKLKELLVIYKDAADKTIQPWLETFPGSNPGSPMQVLECLKSKWGIEPKATDPKTREIKPCTDNATLTPYALENPIIECLLFWRSLLKDCQYLRQYIEAAMVVRGFTVLRGNYSQNADQCTGRSSSSSPNLQNVPTPTVKRNALGLPPVRTAFEAPPGYKFILVDLAGSHGQIARYLAQDPKLIEANESGIKLHFYTVQGILAMRGVNADVSELAKAKKDKSHPLAKYVSELYDPAKTVFYGGLNLNGAVTLQNSFLKKADMLVPLETCKLYIDGGKKAYAGVTAFQYEIARIGNSMREEKTFEVFTSTGWQKVGAMTKVYGTSRSIDGARIFIEKKPNKFKNNKFEAPISDLVSYQWMRPEGTIMKKSLRLVVDFLVENKIDGWLSQFCHDEAMCCVKEEHAYVVAEFMINKITEVFRELIPDYQPESFNPKDYIISNWSEK
jgi:DNA polymerase I-like protein with 3'-5' exonuclease and polymerase domains